MTVVGGRAVGRRDEVAVGLGDHDHVGQLHDPPLDALELIAAGRRDQQHEDVDQLGHGHIGLAGPDGLHDHHVEARGLTEQQRLAGAAGHTADRAPRRRGTDVGLLPTGELLHPGLVAQDRSARAGAGRVDGENGDPVAGIDEVHAEGLDEGGLAGPGLAGDAHPHGAAGGGQELLDEGDGVGPVVGPLGLHQGDGPGQGPAVAGADGLRRGRHGRATALRGARAPGGRPWGCWSPGRTRRPPRPRAAWHGRPAGSPHRRRPGPHPPRRPGARR